MQTGCKSFRLWNLTAALLVTLGLVGGGGSSGSVVATPTNGRGETRQTSTTSRCWTTREYEKNCYHADPLDLATSSTGYLLTEDMLERSVSPYNVSDASIHRAFHRARERGVMNVVVLGGSVTYGHRCVTPSGAKDLECAWPFRLQQWFDAMFDNGTKVEVVNAATPATDMLDFLHNDIPNFLPENADVDLIIVDTGVNDAVIEHFDFDVNNVKLTHEVFIRYVQYEMLHSPAILYAESFICPRQVRAKPRQRINMAQVHGEVTQRYGVPMASFRHAVWPDEDDSTTAEAIWGSEVHPDWRVQQLLADVVVYYLEKSYARFCEMYGPADKSSSQEVALRDFKKQVGCLAADRTFKADYKSYRGPGHGPPPEMVQSETHGWSFSKDAHHETAIIGFGNSSSEAAIATFDLPCSGDHGILDIGYLLSYNGMGAVKVVIEATPDELARRQQEPNFGLHHPSVTHRGAGVKGGLDIPNDGLKSAGSQGKKRGRDEENNDMLLVTIVDALWRTRASVMGYQAMPIPRGIRGGDIRVTFEILSEAKELEYDVDINESGERRDRGDRKFKLVNMQCC